MKYNFKFEYLAGMSNTTYQIIHDVINGLNDRTYENIMDAIYDVLDRDLIYYRDQWNIMEDFQLPSEACYEKAVEYLIDFIHDCMYEV